MGGQKVALEEAYAHINNGGLSFKIVEVRSKREQEIHAPPVPGEDAEQLRRRLSEAIKIETLHNRRWYLQIRTSHFGSGVTFKFPLGNPTIVRWLIEALQRTLARMVMPVDQPTDGFEFAFRETEPLRISHHGGRKVDFKWPFDYQQSSKSSEGSG